MVIVHWLGGFIRLRLTVEYSGMQQVSEGTKDRPVHLDLVRYHLYRCYKII